MLARFNVKDPFGEPMNVILSSMSSPDVLEPEGFLVWATALGFGVSCLGQGDDEGFMYANLGAENPHVQQGSMSGNNGVLRWNYGLPSVGTCRETIEGGNHFRWFIQNTGRAGTAVFLASSYEEGLDKAHTISPNGYNNGRDNIVDIATRKEGIEWEGNKYSATVQWVEAGRLLNATSDGINHPEVAPPNGTAIDGRVAVLYVHTILRNHGNGHAFALTTPMPLMAAMTAAAVFACVVL
ncbi:uncharacterized protein MJAP1_001543 [Malassezia japonica]|uniref:Uncharacterized protein n=1 Tax=Malassezia japonica TaxID=223818 RepID=A0AAF0F1Z7_9BASI|nr:uncharacterized protein MJAP1_001543 [Malassezia japonica]WFD38584.1 hypothetical protein MJAP1_001543 [Malassezia japonica]